jgi:uncharacterized membrane protein
MNKRDFLLELEEELREYNYKSLVIKEVLEDHQNLIEEAVERGFTEADYIATLSSPRQIAKSLKNVEQREKDQDHKLVALSPFLAVIAFFLIGFGTGAWHPGWLVFLSIPIAGVLFEDVGEWKLLALSPFLSVIVFFLIGHYLGRYDVAFLVFFSIPALGLVKKTRLIDRISLVAFIVFPLVYLYLQLTSPASYWWIVLTPLALLGLLSGAIQIRFDMKAKYLEEYRSRLVLLIGAVVLLLIGYLAIGFFTSAWHPWWVLVMVVPMLLIYITDDEDQFNVVAYTPFIAVMLFFLVGHYFNVYQLSWLFFLLIPIAGVLGDS